MFQFANGMHYVYDPANNSFVPAPSLVDPMKEIDVSFFVSHHQDSPDGPYSPSSLSKDPSEEPRRRHPVRIPRPRNAFMIFRSEFSIKRDVEHDHRQISRIAGHCWNQMSEADKEPWRVKADQEKLDHIRKYPDYRFTPLTRDKKPVKRNTKRNGEDDKERCRRLADLLLAGKEGDELIIAIDNPGMEDHKSFRSAPLETKYSPPFRSPLLPPTEVAKYQSSSPFTSAPVQFNAYTHAQSRPVVSEPHYVPVKTESAYGCSSRPPYPQASHHDRSAYSLSPARFSDSPAACSLSSSYRNQLSYPSTYPESPTYPQPASFPTPSPTAYYSSHRVQVSSRSQSVDVSQSYTFQPTTNMTGPRSSRIIFSNPFEQHHQQHASRSRPHSNLALSPVGPLQFDLPVYYSNH